MNYSVYVHPEAERDAEVIASYIAERSFEGMLSWLDAFDTAQSRLRANPNQCGFADEEPIIGRGLRQIFFKTPAGNRYRAVYLVDGDQVTILRVRSYGQGPLRGQEIPN